METRRTRRRLSSWVVLVVYLLISLSGWIRMLSSVNNWYWLNFAGVTPGPLYLAVTGGLWGLVGLVALVWLWQQSPGWRIVGSGVALFFALTYWADRVLVMNAEYSMQNAAFAAAVTLLSLIYVFITLRPWQEVLVFLN